MTTETFNFVMIPNMKTNATQTGINAEPRRTQSRAENLFSFFLRVSLRPLRLCVCLGLVSMTTALAASNDLSGLLQRGLFEEEANRNLDAASAAYETLVKQFDKDRQIGATAVFRLGEVYRKQGKTNEAAAQYERIVRDFAEQTTLVTLSRQNLTGLRPPENRSTRTTSPTSFNEMRENIERFQQMIASYHALPPTNRLDSLCALFSANDETAVACQEVALVRTSLNRFRLDNLSPNHPAVVKLQIKLESLEAKIETSVREKIGQLVPLVASLEKELQRREALEGSTPGTIASINRDPDLAQLKKLSRPELLQVLPTLVPDQLLTKLLEQQNSNAAKLVELSQDHGPMSPEIQKLNAVREVLDKQIDDRVAGILKAVELRSSTLSGSNVPTGVATVDHEEAEIRRLQTLIQNSPDLINGVPGKQSPLCFAALNGYTKLAAFLLENGAEINKATIGATPLQIAVQRGHKAMVEFLLQRGATVDELDGAGGTALHLAADNGFLSIAEVLVKHKAALNARRNLANGEITPLHLAVARGHRVMSEFLIERGADVNAPSNKGRPPIFDAVREGHTDLLSRLLALGAKPDLADAEGLTALTSVATDGKLEAVKVLLAAKADPNLETKSGQTALSFAVHNGHEQIAQLLLDAGAKPNLGSLDVPLLVAARSGHRRIAELLLARGADANQESTSSVEVGMRESIPSPTASRPSAAVKLQFGPYSPLQIAVARKDVEMVNLLLKAKADPNTKHNPTWFTPVGPLLFLVLDNEAMLRAFLEAGADAKARSNINDTPALVAAAQGQQEAVRLLLKHGAEVNATDGNRNTGLHYAVERGNDEIAKLLLKKWCESQFARRA